VSVAVAEPVTNGLTAAEPHASILHGAAHHPAHEDATSDTDTDTEEDLVLA